jgi:hypothetical protein
MTVSRPKAARHVRSPLDRLRIVLLCARPPTTARTIVDHINALTKYSRHDTYCFEHVGLLSNRLPTALTLESFDVLALHYSTYILNEDYLGTETKRTIAAFQGLKVLFLQDEYRLVDRAIENIRRLGIHVLFTCVPEDQIEKVYPAERLPGVLKINNLTGYVPEDLVQRDVAPVARRAVDVGYRTRMVPFWLGGLGALKWQIVPRFRAATAGAGLVCDFSYREEGRIYGEDWIRYMTSCKAILGVESGASVFDFSGELQRRVEEYVSRHPDAFFEEVQEKFLREHEGKIRLNQISPRCFEAAALRTAMILIEGEYSGVLKPWRHYVPLKTDMSNIHEVVEILKNPLELQRIADRAYEEVARNPANSYRRFVANYDAVIARAVTSFGTTRTVRPLSPAARARIAIKMRVVLLLRRLWMMVPESRRRSIKPYAGDALRWLRQWIWGP